MAFSISRGIVSGLRKWEDNQFVQTDASINAGNSGGPMVGKDGEVLALVSWKVGLPGFEGLAFGVPAQLALASLGLSAGAATTLDLNAVDTSSPAAVAAADAPSITDAEDPSFTQLPVEPTALEKTRVFSFKEHKLYNGWRYGLVLGGAALAVGGSIMGWVSWHKYNDATSSTAFFPGKPDTYNEPIEQDQFDKYKALNITGWTLAGVGLAGVITFLATGKDTKELTAEAEAEERGASTAATKKTRPHVSGGLTGAGLILEGRF